MDRTGGATGRSCLQRWHWLVALASCLAGYFPQSVDLRIGEAGLKLARNVHARGRRGGRSGMAERAAVVCEECREPSRVRPH
eukprot:7378443-Pyramimonas_sp.AAC.1